MAKDFIINTSGLNSWGTRVLTSGLDIGQFKRNPVLLYMHRRGFEDDRTPIGRVENVRVEGDELRGTPIFDTKDPFAAEIGRKWEEDFLRMCSAGAEPVELSSAPEHLLPGQTRATVTRSKLVEVSIVDIGSNDDALQLYQPDGELLKLAAGADSVLIPLLKLEKQPEAETSTEGTPHHNNQTNFSMNNNFLTLLGLPATATEADAISALSMLQTEAKRAETLNLALITTAVDTAINVQHKATADKRENLIELGKKAGFEVLKSTLDMLNPAVKPNQLINPSGAAASATVTLAYSQMSETQLVELRKNNPDEFLRLFKAEFGITPELGKQ